MKIFIDTEFQEYSPNDYKLISLGAIREDGACFYAEADWWDPKDAHPWLQKNVVPHLKGNIEHMDKTEMRSMFRQFVGTGPVEFWGYYSTHDWYLMMDMMGGWMNLPTNWQQWCNDIQCVRTVAGTLRFPEPPMAGNAHNALDDAIWTKDMYDHFVRPMRQGDK